MVDSQLKYEEIVEIKTFAGPCLEAVNELLPSPEWVLLDFYFINHPRQDGTYYTDIWYVLGRRERQD